MNARRLFLIAALSLLACATVAWAAEEAEVLSRATTLDSDYHSLRTRFDADVEPHAVLKADFEALEARRETLVADRAALPPGCGCVAIDALLAHAQADSDYLKGTMGGWEEN